VDPPVPRRDHLDRAPIGFFRLRGMLDYSLVVLGSSLRPILIFSAGLSEEYS
jgi:hypothetical protein